MNFTTSLTQKEIILLHEFNEIRSSDTFKKHLANLDILPDDIDIVRIDARIKWFIEFQTRDWGISGITNVVESIRTVIDWELLHDRSMSGTLSLSFEDAVDGWKINNQMKMTEGGALSPDFLTIDFKTKEVEVS